MFAAGSPLSPWIPSFEPINRIVYVPRPTSEIDPFSFLEFAVEDYSLGTFNGRTNALSNAKKAVSSRVDALLYASGLGRFARDGLWSFKQRVSTLAEIGYSTPAGLDEEINKPRNALEHQYRYVLSPLQLRRALELATPYLENTDKYLDRGYIRAAEFSPYRARSRDVSLRKPRKQATVLIFDYDLDILDCYSGRGVHVAKPFKELGVSVLISIFQVLIRAAVSDPRVCFYLPDEAAFLRMMR